MQRVTSLLLLSRFSLSFSSSNVMSFGVVLFDFIPLEFVVPLGGRLMLFIRFEIWGHYLLTAPIVNTTLGSHCVKQLPLIVLIITNGKRLFEVSRCAVRSNEDEPWEWELMRSHRTGQRGTVPWRSVFWGASYHLLPPVFARLLAGFCVYRVVRLLVFKATAKVGRGEWE